MDEVRVLKGINLGVEKLFWPATFTEWYLDPVVEEVHSVFACMCVCMYMCVHV